MSLASKVLSKDYKEASKLKKFIGQCHINQKSALRQQDETTYYRWVLEQRRARRELMALFKSKQRHDLDKMNIKSVVNRLESQGINADVVRTAHYITLAE